MTQAPPQMDSTVNTDGSPMLLEERRGGVVYLTLNRPEKLNAINNELGFLLVRRLFEFEVDDDVRAVVLGGAGRAFCAGDDIRSRPPGAPPRPRVPATANSRHVHYFEMLRAIRQFNKPFITRVHGIAYGAGCDLVLASDIAIAGESARLALVYVKRALAAGTYLAAKHVGLKKATELLFTGEPVDGTEAARLGLVTRCVPDAQLDAEVEAWASRMAAAPTRSLGYLKAGINHGLSADLSSAFEFAGIMQSLGTATEDSAETRLATAERRPPVFTGR